MVKASFSNTMSLVENGRLDLDVAATKQTKIVTHVMEITMLNEIIRRPVEDPIIEGFIRTESMAVVKRLVSTDSLGPLMSQPVRDSLTNIRNRYLIELRSELKPIK